ILQHGNDRPGFQLRGEQPFRATNRKAQTGEHPLTNPLRRADPKSTAHRDSRFCRPLAKRPGRTAGTLLVDDSLMLDQVAGGLRSTVRCEIGGRTDHTATTVSDFADGRAIIAEWVHSPSDGTQCLDTI